jgi:hypothetical protein
MSGMAILVREEIQQRREGRRLTSAITRASRALLERARAVDEAMERARLPQCRQETPADEDERLERDQAECWEALYVAAVEFDALLANIASPFAERVMFYASMHKPLDGGWTSYGGQSSDGQSFAALYHDGRGRPIAALTDEGDVVATGWQCWAGPLPDAP